MRIPIQKHNIILLQVIRQLSVVKTKQCLLLLISTGQDCLYVFITSQTITLVVLYSVLCVSLLYYQTNFTV